MKRILPWLLVVLAGALPAADEPTPDVADLPYKAGELTPYEVERCKLDLWLPPASAAQGFSTLVWFHGGGLTQGDKAGVHTRRIGRSLAAEGLAVATVSYRLSPKATYPAYCEDAAAAVAWVRAHIAERGGRPERVFVGGHSAGGYLAAMLAMDARLLARHGLQPTDLAGYIPVSGQMMTHYQIREERGIPKACVVADEAAPIRWVRKDAPPLLVLYADRDMASRAEECAYFVAALKAAGCKTVRGLQIADRTHNTVADKIAQPADPARQALLAFVQETVSGTVSSPPAAKTAPDTVSGAPR